MNMQANPRWISVCQIDDIPKLGSRVVAHPSGNIAVFRTAGNTVFALLDHCPHKGGPLSQGIVHGESVTCPLHSWNIDLNTGEARAPDQGCARRFPSKIEAGQVFIAIGI